MKKATCSVFTGRRVTLIPYGKKTPNDIITKNIELRLTGKLATCICAILKKTMKIEILQFICTFD